MLSSTSKAILAVSAVFIVLSTVAVALRVKARRVNSQPLKADDFVVCAALVSLHDSRMRPVLIYSPRL